MPADEDSLLKHGLELQVSLLACQAIETGDPIGFLQDQLIYHNAAEYHLHEKGPLRCVLATAGLQPQVHGHCMGNSTLQDSFRLPP